MKSAVEENPVKGLSLAIGAGILAGIAGTAAITVSQMIEMRITKRSPSTTPVKAVSKVLNVKPTRKDKNGTVSQEIHWTYGTSWGIPRGLIAFAGLQGWPATLLHFAAIWATELTMLPSLDVAPPVTDENPKDVAIDALHHAVYAVAAGLVYDAIRKED